MIAEVVEAIWLLRVVVITEHHVIANTKKGLLVQGELLNPYVLAMEDVVVIPKKDLRRW